MKPTTSLIALLAFLPTSALAQDSGTNSLLTELFGPPPSVVLTRPSVPPAVINGYLKLGFDRLSTFTYVTPAYNPSADPKAPVPTGEEQIPAEIRKWSGKKAVVTGFMLPVKLEKGLVTEFYLQKDQMTCCYGAAANLNDFVLVKMKKGVPILMDVPISLYGTFKVAPIVNHGFVATIYTLDGEKLEKTND